jgi:hypothetical protein
MQPSSGNSNHKEQPMTRPVQGTCFNVPPASNLIKAGFKLYRPEKPWSFVDALYLRKRI